MPNSYSARKLLSLLQKNHGFFIKRQNGSHVFLEHPDGRTTVIPLHSGKTLGTGLLKKILKDVNLDKNTLKQKVK